MWQWGYNQTGNLGDNTTVNRSSPVQVGTDTTWTKEWSGGNQHRVAIKTDGTLWTWGDNSDRGQLGQNQQGAPTSRSSPIQVGTGTNWSKVAKMFGGYGSAAIKTDGTLWMWGNNAAGACGINNNTATGFSSPVQVPGTTWKAISIIGNFTGGMATKTDGTLWSWGYNSQGTLGHNTGGAGTDRSSPIQVGTDTDWDEPLGALGGYGGGITCRKTDTTLWTWGSNSYGEQGLNDRVARSSPTQLPGKWEQTAGGALNGILGIKYPS
jgi:alpha-tubulin suppressor-like RCC1 family protein